MKKGFINGIKRRFGTLFVATILLLVSISVMVMGASQLHWGFGDGEDLPSGENRGVSYFVDGASGNDAWNGLTWATAKRTIQAAVNTVTSGNGDYIFVKSGTYTENVNVNKGNLHLIGEDQHMVNVDSFSVSSDDVEISGFRIGPANPNSTLGSVSASNRHLNLHHNIIEIPDSGTGVYLWSSFSTYAKIYSNLIRGESYQRGTGIEVLTNGVHHSIYDNDFWAFDIGIKMDTMYGWCYIYNNRFHGTNSPDITGGYGIKIIDGDYNSISQNWMGYCTTPIDDAGIDNAWLDNHWDGWDGAHTIQIAHSSFEQTIASGLDVPSEGKVTVRFTFNPNDANIPNGATITVRIRDPSTNGLLGEGQWTKTATPANQVFPTAEATVDGGKNNMYITLGISSPVTGAVDTTYEIMDA
jgi:hypothetical protein